MRGGLQRGGLALLVTLLALIAARVRAEAPPDEDVLAALQLWREEPLDLGSATATELTLLPWLDLAQAEGIVGLRAAGALRSLDDLRMVPGIDAETIAALAPFVTLPSTRAGGELGVRLDAAARSATAPSLASALRARWGGVWADLRVRTAAGLAPPTVRGAVGGSQRGVNWSAGGLRARFGLGLLEGDPATRSRTGPVGVAEGFGLEPHRNTSVPPRWAGAGAVGRAGVHRWLVAVGRPAHPARGQAPASRIVAGWERVAPERGGTGTGAALVYRVGEPPDVSAWGDWSSGIGRGRAELARVASGSTRAAAVLRVRGDRWRLGAGVSADARGGGEGADPVSGQALDRPHAALQLDGAARVERWALEALWRRLERGGPGDEVWRERAQVAAQGPGAGAVWRVWARLDLQSPRGIEEASGDPPGVQVGLRWRDAPESAPRGAWLEREFTLRQEWTAAGGMLLLAAASVGSRAGGREGWIWRVGAGTCSGNRSALWVVGIPGLGVDSAWIAAGGVRLLAALFREQGRTRLAASLAVEGEQGIPPAMEVQLRLELIPNK